MQPDELKDLDYAELAKKITAKFESDYEEKMGVIGEGQRKYLEKVLCLQVLDTAWREHLYQMDILKTGIGLRGYNQKDPLTEYKKESFNLFMELVSRIKFESIKLLTAVRLSFSEPTESAPQEAQDSEAASAPESEERPGKKVSRNDPCPCGSGKKYKDCHGKSGPKKGAFAEDWDKI